MLVRQQVGSATGSPSRYMSTHHYKSVARSWMRKAGTHRTLLKAWCVCFTVMPQRVFSPRLVFMKGMPSVQELARTLHCNRTLLVPLNWGLRALMVGSKVT